MDQLEIQAQARALITAMEADDNAAARKIVEGIASPEDRAAVINERILSGPRQNLLFSPFHYAVWKGNREILGLLIPNGADLQSEMITRATRIAGKNPDGSNRKETVEVYKSLLTQPLARGNNDLASLLLKAGVIVDTVDRTVSQDGTIEYDLKTTPPLRAAVGHKASADVLRLLLERKPNPTLADSEDNTAVHGSAQSTEEKQRMLLDYCADHGYGAMVNQNGYMGVLPIEYAQELPQIKLFLHYGADVDKLGAAAKSNETALDFLLKRAAERQKPEITAYLTDDPYRPLREALLRPSTEIKAKPGNSGGFTIEGKEPDVTTMVAKIEELYAVTPERAGKRINIDASQGALRGFLTAMAERKQEMTKRRC